jgi:hypothetical protein
MQLILAAFLPLISSAQQLEVTDFGAVANDGGDDTSAFIACAAKNPAVIHVPSGTFVCNGATFTNSVKIVGEPGTVLTRTAAVHIVWFKGTGLTAEVDGITFDGATLAKSAVVASDLSRFSLTNCEVKRCGIPGFSKNHRGPVDGVFLVGVANASIMRSKFISCERDGLLGWPVERMYVQSCLASGCGRSGFTSDRAISTGPLWATFLDNVATNCGAIGFYAEAVSNTTCEVKIARNKVINCGADDWEYGWGIVAGNFTSGRIEENEVINYGHGGHSPTTGSAIAVGDYANDIVIAKNRIVAPRRVGILVNNTRANKFKVSIIDNEVEESGEQGIYVYRAPGTEVIANAVRNPGRDGALVHLSGQSIVVSNTFTLYSQEAAKDHAVTTRLSFRVKEENNRTVLTNRPAPGPLGGREVQ